MECIRKALVSVIRCSRGRIPKPTKIGFVELLYLDFVIDLTALFCILKILLRFFLMYLGAVLLVKVAQKLMNHR